MLKKMITKDLTEGPISGHVKRIAIPVSIGFFFNTMYNVVDSLYAGQISTTALAALALSFPIFFILLSLSEGLSKGTSVLIANAVGAKDQKLKTQLTVQGLSLGVLTSFMLTVFGLFGARFLLGALGAEGELLQLSLAYLHPIFYGTLFFIMSSMANASLLAHGDSKTLGRYLVIGFFLNLILNPWFLYGGFGIPALGIAGVGWATVLINAIGAFVMLITVIRRGFLSGVSKRCFVPDLSVYRMILKQGLPTSFNMMTIALSFFVITYFLQLYGENVVAAFGVVTRIEQIALLPMIGVGVALTSVAGQNNGAKKFDRVKESFFLAMKYGLWLVLIGAIGIYFGAEKLMQLFTDDAAVVAIGVRYIHIMAFIQWTYVVTFTSISFLQAIKKPLYGFWESLIRKVFLPGIIFSYVVLWKELHYTALWWSIVGINLFMTAVTYIYVRKALNKF